MLIKLFILWGIDGISIIFLWVMRECGVGSWLKLLRWVRVVVKVLGFFFLRSFLVVDRKIFVMLGLIFWIIVLVVLLLVWSIFFICGGDIRVNL